MNSETSDHVDPDDDHTICRSRVDPHALFELHECQMPGKWVGIADNVYADVVHGNWMEGYKMSFTGLPTGNIQVVVTEGLCNCETCREQYMERLQEIYDE